MTAGQSCIVSPSVYFPLYHVQFFSKLHLPFSRIGNKIRRLLALPIRRPQQPILARPNTCIAYSSRTSRGVCSSVVYIPVK